MHRVIVAAIVLMLAAGCAAPGSVRPALTQSELLSGGNLFAQATEKPIPAADVVALDERMRRFVAESVGGVRGDEGKLRALLSHMRANDLLSVDYDSGATQTVRGTFYSHRANCLSYTMLFVNLARSAGLRVRYEIVDVPPSWSQESGIVILARHINAHVAAGRQGGYAVDFDSADFRTTYRRYDVSDRYALALFYTNRGAEALLEGHYANSFVNLREALRTDASVAGAWENLGLLYARLEQWDYAEAAYLQALAISPDAPTALTNLATLYDRTGDTRAETVRERVAHVEQRNPYYHYFRALDDYRHGRFEDALAAVGKALRLKRDEPDFYLLQARTYLHLDRHEDADRSFDRAERTGAPAKIRSDDCSSGDLTRCARP